MKHWEIIAQQCENQGALDPQDVARFAEAYFYVLEEMRPWSYTREAKLSGNRDVVEEIVTWPTPGHVLVLGKKLGQKEFRNIPVKFQNGNSGLAPAHIRRQLRLLLEGAQEGMSSRTFYKAFEEIHPFEDCNGRVGHLLWAWHYRNLSGEWPRELPPVIEEWDGAEDHLY